MNPITILSEYRAHRDLALSMMAESKAQDSQTSFSTGWIDVATPEGLAEARAWADRQFADYVPPPCDVGAGE